MFVNGDDTLLLAVKGLHLYMVISGSHKHTTLLALVLFLVIPHLFFLWWYLVFRLLLLITITYMRNETQLHRGFTVKARIAMCGLVWNGGLLCCHLIAVWKYCFMLLISPLAKLGVFYALTHLGMEKHKWKKKKVDAVCLWHRIYLQQQTVSQTK